mgnify:FL=1|tara:strand:- start:348 stop:542 length:195 start_codon:yes stop_codon:yes gene_type:complete
MAKEISAKNCSSCETKYTITWDINEQDLEPLVCPFCGYEVESEDGDDDEEYIYDNKNDTNDSWD